MRKDNHDRDPGDEDDGTPAYTAPEQRTIDLVEALGAIRLQEPAAGLVAARRALLARPGERVAVRPPADTPRGHR